MSRWFLLGVVNMRIRIEIDSYEELEWGNRVIQEKEGERQRGREAERQRGREAEKEREGEKD